MTNLFQSPIKSWLTRRFPPSNQMSLGHKNIFIMPNSHGFWLLFCILVLFILGTNYQNNPILLVCFFIISIGIYAIHTGFNNLNGITIKLLSVNNVYAGQHCTLTFDISHSTSNNKAQHLTAIVDGKRHLLKRSLSQPTIFSLSLTQSSRGKFTLPPIIFRSDFPFGLIKAWSYFRASSTIVVYPTPVTSDWQMIAQAAQDDLGLGNDIDVINSGETNFEGIKSYVPGASLSHVAWKQVAKSSGDNLMLKEFVDSELHSVFLSLESVPSASLELALSQLTAACLELHQANKPFGLHLQHNAFPTITVAPSASQIHLDHCLSTLATFAQSSTGNDENN